MITTTITSSNITITIMSPLMPLPPPPSQHHYLLSTSFFSTISTTTISLQTPLLSCHHLLLLLHDGLHYLTTTTIKKCLYVKYLMLKYFSNQTLKSILFTSKIFYAKQMYPQYQVSSIPGLLWPLSWSTGSDLWCIWIRKNEEDVINVQNL